MQLTFVFSVLSTFTYRQNLTLNQDFFLKSVKGKRSDHFQKSNLVYRVSKFEELQIYEQTLFRFDKVNFNVKL